MPTQPRRRRAKGEGTITTTPQGRFRATINLGVDPTTGKNTRPSRVFETKQEASDWLDGIRDEKRGRITPRSRDLTVEKMIDQFIRVSRDSGKAKGTVNFYETFARTHIVPALGDAIARDVTTDDVEDLISGLTPKRGTDVSDYVRRGVLVTLSAAYEVAIRRRALAYNPARFAAVKRPVNRSKRFYTIDEVARILGAAKNEPNPARFVIALLLGPRQGECLGMQWSDIEWSDEEETGIIRIERQLVRAASIHGCDMEAPCGMHVTRCPQRPAPVEVADLKTSRSHRSVPITKEVAIALDAQNTFQKKLRLAAGESWQNATDGTGWIFTDAIGRPLAHRADTDAWKSLLHKANVPERRLHDARHTAATMAVGVIPDRVVMEMFGWASMSMMSHYSKVLPETYVAAARALSDNVHAKAANPQTRKRRWG